MIAIVGGRIKLSKKCQSGRGFISPVQYILVNLLTNAVKYSALGQPIVVEASRGTGSVTVSVQDAGIGISLNEQQHIFERFFRVQGTKEYKYDGYGIGLFISADIIQ